MIRRWLWIPLVAFLAAAAWVTRLGTRWPSIYVMTGPSMEPTVRAGEYFFAWSPPGRLERGAPVLFRYEDADGVFHVLRRLVGLPGDTVAMRDGDVVVNGQIAPWPTRIIRRAARYSTFAREGVLYDWGPWVVAPDSVLLLADTRDMVGWPDSRFVGLIARDQLVARASRTLRGRALY